MIKILVQSLYSGCADLYKNYLKFWLLGECEFKLYSYLFWLSCEIILVSNPKSSKVLLIWSLRDLPVFEWVSTRC